MSLPRDVLFHLFGYAALHSTPSLALTCKAVLAHTRTRAYWRWAVRKRLRERLEGRIDEERLQIIDIFVGLPDDKNWHDVLQRILWLFPRIGHYNGWSYYVHNNAESGEIRVLEILEEASNRRLAHWQWHKNDYYDFGIETSFQNDDRVCQWTTELPLHPTVRKRHNGRPGGLIYEIVDEKRQRLWIGPATYAWDAEHGHGTMVPATDSPHGAWHAL